MDAPRRLAATVARFHGVEDRAVHLAVAEVGDGVVLEVLEERFPHDDGLDAVQQVGETFTLALHMADEAATHGVPDEGDQHSASRI